MLDKLPESRVTAPLRRLGEIEHPREPWRVAHLLPEVLLPVVCDTLCDGDDDLVAAWGVTLPAFLRRSLPDHHGRPVNAR